MEKIFGVTTINYWNNVKNLWEFSKLFQQFARGHDMYKGATMLADLFKEIFSNSRTNRPALQLQNNETAVALVEGASNNSVEFVYSNIFNKFLFDQKKSSVAILNRNVLISLVSSYEVLISESVHNYYCLYPKALSDDKKALSFNDLYEFETKQDAVDYLVSDKVDSIIRGSLSSWRKYFKKEFSIDLTKTVPDWDEFEEMFQRRHLFVHNDGKVNKQYLSEVSDAWLDGQGTLIGIGDTLDVSEAYLSKAIKTFLMAGIVLCDQMWSKLVKEEAIIRDATLSGIIYKLTIDNEWDSVASLCSYIISRRKSLQPIEIIFKLNLCLSLKNLGDSARFRKYIKSINYSHVHPKFKLHYLALIDNTQEFFDLLPQGSQLGVLKQELVESPMFVEMRKMVDFNRILNAYY